MQIIEGAFQQGNKPEITYRMLRPEGTQGPLPGVIFAGGLGSSIGNLERGIKGSDYIEQSLPLVAAANAAVIGFNYRNTITKDGKVDTGKFTCDGAAVDLDDVITFLQHHEWVQPHNIIAMGVSFGAHTVIHSRNPAIKGRIVYSLVPDLVKPFKEELNWRTETAWRLKQALTGRGITRSIDGDPCVLNYKLRSQSKKFVMAEVAKNITTPLLIIQGTNDPLGPKVDIEAFDKLLINSPDHKPEFIEGAGHKFSYTPKDGQAISEFGQAIQYTGEKLLEFFAVNRADHAIVTPLYSRDETPMFAAETYMPSAV